VPPAASAALARPRPAPSAAAPTTNAAATPPARNLAQRPIAPAAEDRPVVSSVTPSRPVPRRLQPGGEGRADAVGAATPKRPIGAIPRS
jgi:hypothetical protein